MKEFCSIVFIIGLIILIGWLLKGLISDLKEHKRYKDKKKNEKKGVKKENDN